MDTFTHTTSLCVAFESKLGGSIAVFNSYECPSSMSISIVNETIIWIIRGGGGISSTFVEGSSLASVPNITPGLT